MILLQEFFKKKLALYFHIEDITIYMYSVKIPWKSFNKSAEKNLGNKVLFKPW